MKCKFCKNEIPNGSIFCNWCGERQVKERKKKDEIKVPKPRQLPSGKWFIQLRAEGQSITEETEALCIAKARAIRAGFIELKKKPQSITLTAAIDKYIDDNRAKLSPATIRGYRSIQKCHFQPQMNISIGSKTDWQAVIDAELEKYSTKTLTNAWAFVGMILRINGVSTPKINFTQKAKKTIPWLDYEQILEFLEVIRDKPCEIAALLALHSLRRSEFCAVTWSHIDLKNNTITVSGSRVINEDEELVHKPTNKNVSSQRTIPIMIPRLQELLEMQMPKVAPSEKETFIVTLSPHAVYSQINRACEKAGLPKVGCHGLRHSFASLGYHLKMSELEIMEIGGWSDYQTVHKIYTHLSKLDLLKGTNKMAEFYKNANELLTEN